MKDILKTLLDAVTVIPVVTLFAMAMSSSQCHNNSRRICPGWLEVSLVLIGQIAAIALTIMQIAELEPRIWSEATRALASLVITGLAILCAGHIRGRMSRTTMIVMLIVFIAPFLLATWK